MGKAVVNRTVEADGTVVIDLRGEIDVVVERALRELLVDIVSDMRPPRVIIDMLHVTFVDSTGIGALVAGYNAATAAGTAFTVRHLAPFVARQLRTTGLYARLTGAEA